MRRSFALALASFTIGIGSLFAGAQGCQSNALGVQDLCGWIADECNCYRRFAAGVANSTVTNDVGQKPLCGVQLDSNKNAINSATNKLYNPQSQKPTSGTFLKRDKLDICILTGSDGGQIVFDPPLDPLTFPPANFTFKMLDGTGKLCGDGSFGTTTSFSIGFPAPEGVAGAGGSTGGAGGTTTTTTGGLECRGTGGTGGKSEDPAREAISYGRFTMAVADPENVVTTTCPNDEEHRFNLFQLNKCDGTNGSSDYKSLLPSAEVEATAGGVGIPGEVRLRIFWPPSGQVDSLDGAKPITVEYFDCTFPGSIHPCLNGEQDGAETDVDCGFSACGTGCPDGSNCITEQDCLSGICTPNSKGLKKCVATPCGDSLKNGQETCDDGNTNAGDGCSADCTQEPGFTCTGVGALSCVDDNECVLMTDNCNDNAACANTPGSFTCTCNKGFSGDGVMCTAGCGDGVLTPPEACDDVNTNSGDGCSQNCAIETGYTCMGAGMTSCVDINECATGTAMCAPLETCMNTMGSYTCDCVAPRMVCGTTCLDVQTDNFNCGTCGKVCNPGQTCVGGVCTP